VSRKTFRLILAALLVISGFFAAWSWLQPYEWSPDPAARCRVVGCLVEKDYSNYWVSLQLKVPSDQEHDLEQPVRLLLGGGGELEPADTTLVGDKEQPVRVIWLKFWLEEEQFAGPMALKINGGKLTVRSGSGIPKLRSDGKRFYVTHRW